MDFLHVNILTYFQHTTSKSRSVGYYHRNDIFEIAEFGYFETESGSSNNRTTSKIEKSTRSSSERTQPVYTGRLPDNCGRLSVLAQNGLSKADSMGGKQIFVNSKRNKN